MCQKNATYKTDYHCSNCEWAGKLEIKKGSLKPAKAECPNCGCNTANQGSRPIISPIKDGWSAPYKYIKPWKQPGNEPYQWFSSDLDKHTNIGDLLIQHSNRTMSQRLGINGPSEYMGNEYIISN